MSRVCPACEHVEPGCVCAEGPPTRPTGFAPFPVKGPLMATSLDCVCSFCLRGARAVHVAMTDHGSPRICLDCADEAVRHLLPQIVTGRAS